MPPAASRHGHGRPRALPPGDSNNPARAGSSQRGTLSSAGSRASYAGAGRSTTEKRIVVLNHPSPATIDAV